MEENRYDKEDFKELEDVVEKIIKRREKRKEEYAIDEHTGTFPGGERAEPKDLAAKEAPTPEKKKNKMKHVDLILALIVIAGLLIWTAWPSIMPEEVETTIVYPANVVLDSFDDGSNGPYTFKWLYPLGLPLEVIEFYPNYVNVSFQLRNTGDEVAKDVSCFIKCCDQNGTILFAQLFTFDDIGPDAQGKINLPRMRSYRVPVSNETSYVTHNIEVRWLYGMNTYEKLTMI